MDTLHDEALKADLVISWAFSSVPHEIGYVRKAAVLLLLQNMFEVF